MRILSCYMKFFWILVFSIVIGTYAINDLSQDPAAEEPEEEIWIDPDEEQEIKVLPTTAIETKEGEEEKVGLTLNIPIIGKVICYSTKDPKTGKDLLKASLSGKSINLSPVPIYFEDFEISIPSDENPYIHANAILFGRKATVELIEAKKMSAFKETPIETKAGKKVEALSVDISLLKLRIIFVEKPSLSLFPGKSVDLNHLDLLLETKKIAPTLETEINMFGQPIDVQFGFTMNSATIDFTLPNAQFMKVIPFVKDTPLANVNLKSAIISAKYLFAKKTVQENSANTEQKTQSKKDAKKETEEELKQAAESKAIGDPERLFFALTAQVDFSEILNNDLKKYINLNDLTVNATYSLVEGFHMESVVKDFGIPFIGNVNDAKFIIDWSEKKEADKNKKADKEIKKEAPQTENSIEKSKPKESALTISLTGNGIINIPVIGALKYTLSSAYKNKEFVFGGKINESFSYASIKIASEAEFTANITKKIMTITGDTNVNGLNLIAKLNIAPDEKTKETVVGISATAKATNWQPLVGINGLGFLPKELQDITLKNLDARFITEKRSGKKLTIEMVIQGRTNIMNIDVNAEVHFIKNNNQTGVFIKADVPNDKLPSTLEKMQIKDAAFILSTIAYEEKETNTKYAKGLNIQGDFDFTRDLKPIGAILHLERLNIIGVLDPVDIRKSKFNVQIPTILNTGLNIITFGPLSLEISGEPSFRLIAEVIVRPDKNQSLLFKGSSGISGASIAMELNMIGLWRNPFNLISNDFSIGNGTLGFNFITIPPYLDGVKLGGETELSKSKGKDIKFALSIDLSNPTNIALLGQMDGKLTIEEFVSFIVSKVMNQKINLNDIPEISMEDVKISFAPTNANIGALKVEEGITLKGMINLFGKEAALDFEVKRSGAKAQADMSPLNLGPLKISSGITAKGDKRKTKLGGPSIDIELSTARQIFLVTGMLELDYIFSASSDISISRSGIDFNFQTNIGPDKLRLFRAQVKGHSAGPLSNPDFNLHIEMEQKFVNFIKEHIIIELNRAQKELQDKINTAIRHINAIDKQIANAHSSIDKIKKDVEEWKKKVKSFDVQISSKNKEIGYYKSKLSGGSIWSDIGHTVKGAGNTIGDIAKGFGKVTGIFGQKAMKDAKKLIKKGMDAAEQQADKVVWSAKIIELGTEVAALEAAKKSALLTLNGYEATLDKAARQIMVGTLEASKRAAQGFLKGVQTSAIQLLKTGELTVKSLAEGFNVQRVVFDGSLKKIENGKLPNMLFVITILGTEKNIEFNIDFKDVATSVSNLAKYVVKKFVPGI